MCVSDTGVLFAAPCPFPLVSRVHVISPESGPEPWEGAVTRPSIPGSTGPGGVLKCGRRSVMKGVGVCTSCLAFTALPDVAMDWRDCVFVDMLRVAMLTVQHRLFVRGLFCDPHPLKRVKTT